MATIVTRGGKGSPLTNNEVDNNFINLNTELAGKALTSSLATVATTGSYSDLVGTPTNVSAFSNDAGYITSSGSITGNATTATRLATARTISLAGDVTGSATFDGSANITITAAVADDSHAHIIGNIDGLQAALDGKAALGANSDITSMTGITGGISTPDYIDFDTAATPARATGRLWWDNADGISTLNLGMAGSDVTLQVGQETHFRIKASSAITNGQVVMFTGTAGASGALTGAPASGITADTGSYIMGVATESIALNGWGYITQFGLVRGINTSGGTEAWTDGQILYYDPSVTGGLTKNVPTAPNAKVEVAAVVYAHATNGSLFVRVAANPSLEQLSDVETAAASNTDLLQYNGTAGKWEHKSPTLITVGNVSGVVAVANGGTGATTAAGALTNLGAYAASNPAGYTTNTGTVTSVAASAGTGISVTGSPITTSGTLTITNTAPDQTVTLTQGGTTTITGTYPNFTISSADQYSGTVTSVGGTGSVNGLTLSGTVASSGNLTLGGTLAISNADWSGTDLSVANGGTGASTAAGALANLGAQDAATALTTSTTFGGDVSGTYNAIVVADDSHNHIISNVDGLQTALDGKLSTTGKAADSNLFDNLDSVRFVYGSNQYATSDGRTDINNLSKTGHYWSSSATNKPSTGNGTTFHINHDGGTSYATQMFINHDGNDGAYFRAKDAGTWNSWQRIFSDGYAPFNNLTSKTSGTGTYQTSGDFRAPIFYDSDNTGYYIDPASTSASLVAAGPLRSGPATALPLSYASNFSANGASIQITLERTGTSVGWGGIGADINNCFAAWNSSAVSQFRVTTSGAAFAVGSFRAPIFYDSDNTGYYVNPNSSSYVYQLAVANNLDVQTILYTRNNTNILNTAATGWNTVIQRNSGDNWIVYGGDSVRAPIFYDSNNTAYYTDPASTSRLNINYSNHHRTAAADGSGLNFWASDSYKIYMSASGNGTWGGRVAGETTSDYNMYFRMTGGTNRGFVFMAGASGTTAVAGIDASGNGRFIGDVVAYSSSDARLKENLEVIPNALDKVSSLTGYTFDWNDKQTAYEAGKRDVGIVAQDVEAVLPEVVVDREETGYKAVNYEKLVPLLIEAIKELKAEVETLKKG